MTNIVLIPAYQPNDMLLEILQYLRKENFIVVVVNDGSGKDYSLLFERVKNYAIVLEHDVNKGKGAALKTGLNYIKRYFNGESINWGCTCIFHIKK